MTENDPENPTVLFGLANEYVKAENHAEAIATLEAYLKFGTDEGAAYGNARARVRSHRSKRTGQIEL